MVTNSGRPEMMLTVTLRKGADGYVVAECLEIPGCMSQGRTEEEARENILDAIRGCFQVMMEDWLREARHKPLNLEGIQKKETFRVRPPELQPLAA